MTPSYDVDLTVAARYNGPARSGNGGYVAGLLSERVARGRRQAVEVTLRQPPPLDVAMMVRHVGVGEPENLGDRPVTLLSFGGATIAEARQTAGDLRPVDWVPQAAARKVMAGYPGLMSHPFPTCFACGPARAEGDGLRIFPGPFEDRVASLWVPHAADAASTDAVDGVRRVGTGVAWAALDCIGGWSADLVGRPMVLGRMTAAVDALPVVGEEHVVVGRLLGRDGRKTSTASTSYDSDGRIVARAQHTWISVDPSAFNG